MSTQRYPKNCHKSVKYTMSAQQATSIARKRLLSILAFERMMDDEGNFPYRQWHRDFVYVIVGGKL